MIHRPELLASLERAPVGPLATTAWRHMFGRLDPDKENVRGARWNPAGVAAIYLSMSRAGAIAEGDHALDVQPLRPRVRRFVYEVELTLSRVVDLSDPASLAGVGLTLEDVSDDNHSRCREVGAGISWLECDGLLVPSARSDSVNLVVYSAHRSADASFKFDAGEELI